MSKFTDWTPAQFASATLSDLIELRDYAGQLKEQADFHANILHAALSARYKPNDFGTTNFEEGECVIKATVPKNVDWEQGQLAVIRQQLKEVDLDDIVTQKLSVSESAYKALPAAIQKWLEPARTVKAGKTSYKIEIKD